MSSPKSRHAPTVAEHRQALVDALVEVAENSFFAFVSPVDAEQFAELAASPPVMDPEARPQPTDWLVTRAGFSGAFAGHVEVAVAEPLARQLLSAFLGLGPDDPVDHPQLEDSCGEFCNQVCGTWLTRACQDGRFDLDPPVVERHPAGWLPLDPAPAGGHDGDVLVTLNDLPLRLRVHLEPELG
jgi:hypothetical protein